MIQCVQPKYQRSPLTGSGVYATGSCLEGSFTPAQSDCTAYNRCIDNTYVEFSCADGLHWNNAMQVCDWPASANCRLSPGDGSEETNNQIGINITIMTIIFIIVVTKIINLLL